MIFPYFSGTGTHALVIRDLDSPSPRQDRIPCWTAYRRENGRLDVSLFFCLSVILRVDDFLAAESSLSTHGARRSKRKEKDNLPGEASGSERPRLGWMIRP